MERSQSLELQLTEAELESLVNAVRSTSNGRFAAPGDRSRMYRALGAAYPDPLEADKAHGGTKFSAPAIIADIVAPHQSLRTRDTEL